MKRNDYKKRLENLRQRRYDDHLQKAILSEAFAATKYGESVKYALESMSEIDPEYTRNTHLAADNIAANLRRGLQSCGLFPELRRQGSIETNTHIKLHSDIDVLIFTEKYYMLEYPQVPTHPYLGDPNADMKELRKSSYEVLNSIYDLVDDSSSGKAIKVFPTKPKRKVDLVFANWFDSNNYVNAGRIAVHRGINMFDRDKDSFKTDFPFLQIFQINRRDQLAQGGLKKLIRLLKILKVDVEQDYTINLSSFEITGAMYDIPVVNLTNNSHNPLLLMPEASKQLDRLITNKEYRENLRSANGTEFVFGTDESKVVELKKLKLELDELIQDTTEELATVLHKPEDKIVYFQ